MMLLFVVAWILVKATAPWYIWVLFFTHIVGSFFASIFENNRKIDNLIEKLKR